MNKLFTFIKREMPRTAGQWILFASIVIVGFFASSIALAAAKFIWSYILS
jgi:hypothetical protein